MQEDITAFGVRSAGFAQQAQPAKLNSGLRVCRGPDCSSTASGIYTRNLFRK